MVMSENMKEIEGLGFQVTKEVLKKILVALDNDDSYEAAEYAKIIQYLKS